jgi:type IV secretory pathway component VirB8
MKKPTDRIENPFGFVVTGYRADAELVAPARPADVAAGGTS